MVFFIISPSRSNSERHGGQERQSDMSCEVCNSAKGPIKKEKKKKMDVNKRKTLKKQHQRELWRLLSAGTCIFPCSNST